MDCSPSGLSVHGDSPGKNTGVGCHALLLCLPVNCKSYRQHSPHWRERPSTSLLLKVWSWALQHQQNLGTCSKYMISCHSLDSQNHRLHFNRISRDSKEIKSVHPEGNRSWIFIAKTDAEAETPILWPPDAKNWLNGKDPDAEKDWRQEEKGTTEDEMVGWCHQLNGREFE